MIFSPKSIQPFLVTVIINYGKNAQILIDVGGCKRPLNVKMHKPRHICHAHQLADMWFLHRLGSHAYRTLDPVLLLADGGMHADSLQPLAIADPFGWLEAVHLWKDVEIVEHLAPSVGGHS